ncbi:MAG: exosortase family protein XrtG [Syntrophomonadaceae bacterium]|nr:exosortase family protein XrtG [Syntrophomonadaceae bacterium]
MNNRLKLLGGLVIIILVLWLFPPGSWLVPKLVLDGQFGDWRGRTSISDPAGDGRSGNDFKMISWATNKNEEKLYFMLERYPPEPKSRRMECCLFFDLNNNGKYTDQVDKYAQIFYQPQGLPRGEVTVYLYTMEGELKGKYEGQWGEGTGASTSHVEFAIPMKDLEAYPAQYLRFYLADISGRSDRLPDQGDIQWDPFPGASKSRSTIALVFLLWLAITLFLYHHRLWVLYYIWAAVGLCCVLVLFFHASLVEYGVERFSSLILHHILHQLGIVTHIYDGSPGTLLVLIKIDSSWTTLTIDIENSGLIEICIIFSLIVFYPVYRLRKRILVALSGALGIYLINLARLLLVIVIIHSGGRNMSYIAHTLFGRLLFFLLAVGLYWQLITRPSLEKIRRNVKNA